MNCLACETGYLCHFLLHLKCLQEGTVFQDCNTVLELQLLTIFFFPCGLFWGVILVLTAFWCMLCNVFGRTAYMKMLFLQGTEPWRRTQFFCSCV